MNREQLIAAIDEEITRLEQVRNLLQNTTSRRLLRTGSAGRPAKKRVLSAEARQRIAAAQKRRWAAQKKEAAKK
jgi:hypothetical protein